MFFERITRFFYHVPIQQITLRRAEEPEAPPLHQSFKTGNRLSTAFTRLITHSYPRFKENTAHADGIVLHLVPQGRCRNNGAARCGRPGNSGASADKHPTQPTKSPHGKE